MGDDDEPRDRSGTRQAILSTALDAFTASGYHGMSLDQVTAGARVSKQTIYRLFGNKEALFAAVIRAVTDSVDRAFTDVAATLAGTDDLEADLTALGRSFLGLLMAPDALRLRRLVIAEADRFPALSRLYQERGVERVQGELAGALTRLTERGLLRIDDPTLAAAHFTWSVVSIPVNTAMFCGSDTPFSPAELDHYAAAGARYFLAAYRAPRRARK